MDKRFAFKTIILLLVYILWIQNLLGQIDKKIIEDIKLIEENQRKIVNQKADQLQITLRTLDADGNVAEMSHISSNGIPLYKIGFNNGAATTLGTNQLRQGGNLGLALSGQNLVIGEWDQDGVLLTHQEFGGRVIQNDNATITSRHATHVAGTLVASGVNASARGMAPNATLWAYDWNFDLSEMAAAANQGLLISNHSYGFITGWHPLANVGAAGVHWHWFGDTSVNDTIDANFGYYSSTASQWDWVAFNAPDYLIVRSAGNDNNQGPTPGTPHYIYNNTTGLWNLSSTARLRDGEPGGFDCISHSGLSKNILTIGSVSKITNYTGPNSVVLANSSSTGPTDDGRIKPDLVGAGVSIFSSSNAGDNQYATLSGTSMAGPNVAGSLLLVQEHARNLRGDFLKAYTLKSIAIHTAKEAGNTPGPDYKHGWGLADVEAAANVISDSLSNLIFEETLSNNESFQYIVYNDGTKPLRATVAWNDLPATPRPLVLNDRTPTLINDLDLRISRIADSTLFFPWILDPDNPSNAAGTGDNFRDNVEQVLIQNPQPSWYRIQINHKKTLVGLSQPFALIVSGINNQANQIVQVPTTICPNQNFEFTYVSAFKPNLNIAYSVQLSDSLGNFQQPFHIHNFTTNQQVGKVILNIPIQIAPGNNYKIRLFSPNALNLPSSNFEIKGCNSISVTLRNEDCGRTDFVTGGPVGIVNNVVYAQPGIANVLLYRFLCYNQQGSLLAETSSINRFVPISDLGLLNWGEQAWVKVQVLTSTHGWNNPGNACLIGLSTQPIGVPNIEVRSDLCGLNTFNPSASTRITGIDLIQVSREARLSAYQFEVFKTSSNQSIGIINRGNPNLFIRDFPSIFEHGETYIIRVRGFIGSVAGAWSANCTIATTPVFPQIMPTTQIQNRFCESVSFSINGTTRVSGIDFLAVDPIPGASYYEIQVWSNVGGNLLGTLNTNLNGQFFLRDYPNIFTWANTYFLRARVVTATAKSNWGEYCQIGTLPNPAFSTLSQGVTLRQCNQQIEIGSSIRANQVVGASAYRFKVFSNASATILVADVTQNSPNLNSSLLSIGSYYVTASAIIGGFETKLNDTCNITLVGKLRNYSQYEPIDVIAYPNPFQEKINFAFSRTVSGSLRVFDMRGKLVFESTLQNESSVSFGDFWQNGLYLVQIFETSGNVVTLRILKQL